MSRAQESSGRLLQRVGDLLAEPGRRRALEGDFALDGLTVGAAGVAGGALGLQLVLEAQGGQIVVSGTVRADWDVECRRCLGPVSVPVAPTLTEVFEASPAEGETFPLDGEVVDLAPMLREVALLSLPLAPLCDATCQGPAEGAYFGPSDDTEEATGAPRRDPRWAALDDFRPEAG